MSISDEIRTSRACVCYMADATNTWAEINEIFDQRAQYPEITPMKLYLYRYMRVRARVYVFARIFLSIMFIFPSRKFVSVFTTPISRKLQRRLGSLMSHRLSLFFFEYKHEIKFRNGRRKSRRFPNT